MPKRIFASMVISVMLFLIWVADIHADEVKVTASAGLPKGYFGISVDISGDYAIVGSPEDESDNGSAYIFKRDGSSWKQQAKLRAKDGGKDDWFGYSVAISDDYAIVGAPWDDDKGEDTGSVYFFKRNGDSWSEEVKFTPHPPLIKWCKFGYSLDISGDYVIVGSPEEDWASGAAYIFHYDGNSWKEQQAKFTAKDNAAWDDFGSSVSISGDYAIVGAWGDDDKGENSGSIYFFKREGTSWVEQAKITAGDGAANDWFGASVYISGDYAIVGAYGNDDDGADSGSVYIFHYDGISWTEQTKLTASDGAPGEWFGYSVYICDDYAIVSAPKDDDNGIDSGSIYVFIRDGTSWKEMGKYTASDGEVSDQFGISVSISDKYVIVGADGDDDNGFDSGSAYIYHAKDLSLPLPVQPSGHTITTFAEEKVKFNVINEDVMLAKPAQSIPKEFRLLQNFPNPFNPETWIPYQLAGPVEVTIRIYSQSGQIVRTLPLGHKKAGIYLEKSQAGYWDGRSETEEPVASGVYFYQLEAGNFCQTRRMTVLK